MTEIRVMRAIELIRARPAMFFEGGVPTAADLVSHMLEDVADAGAVAEVLQHGEWTMVCADIDWMANARAEFAHLFETFVPPNRNVPNSHRAEVLVVAACRRLLTVGEAGTFSIDLTIEDLPPELLQPFQAAKRAIIWVM